LYKFVCLTAIFIVSFVLVACGDKSADGISIVSIIKTTTDDFVVTYTITYSDGSTSAFTVTDGTNSGLIFSTNDRTQTASIIGYEGESVYVDIPETYKGKTVTAIENDAFNSVRYIEEVTMPDTITSIGSNAFYGCYNLTAITVSNSLETIGVSAFSGCRRLTSITIPDSVTIIGYGAFYNCSGLSAVYYGGADNSAWAAITVDIDNGNLTSANIYYYSETEPAEEGDYWRYVNGVPSVWGQK
jgi:hypothetical protein